MYSDPDMNIRQPVTPFAVIIVGELPPISDLRIENNVAIVL